VLDAQEVKDAPENMKMKKMIGKGCENYQFAVVVSPLDCTGCANCVNWPAMRR
jgi:pyruvate-ferredoxin/flavodoxin oxidoreductase